MNPPIALSGQIDPFGFFAGTAGMAFVGLLIAAALAFLGLLCMYWLIRLAVRHGTMDTVRWYSAEVASLGPSHPHSTPTPPAEPARGARRTSTRTGTKRDVAAPPRNTLEW